jgi:hypothetical protein
MSLQDELKNAIGAHGMWKSHLRKVIAGGRRELPADRARLEHLCRFNRWLDALESREREGAPVEEVRALHARFHDEAARVLRLVEAGKVAEARQAIAVGSAFDQVTTELNATLMEWSRAA